MPFFTISMMWCFTTFVPKVVMLEFFQVFNYHACDEQGWRGAGSRGWRIQELLIGWEWVAHTTRRSCSKCEDQLHSEGRWDLSCPSRDLICLQSWNVLVGSKLSIMIPNFKTILGWMVALCIPFLGESPRNTTERVNAGYPGHGCWVVA